MSKPHGLLAITLLAAAGCSDATTTPGGPGVVKRDETVITTPANPSPAPVDTKIANNPPETTTVANRPAYGAADDTFVLNTPILSTRVKQGETRSITIGVSRGKNFDQDITLNISELPQGVTLEPAVPKILHGDKDAKVDVKATDGAALGEFSANVVGHPETGADATTKLKLTILEK